MRYRRILILLTIGGAAIAVAGAVVDPLRLWANWLLVSFYMLTLALGGICFVAIHDACGATWATAIRRVPEELASLTPFAAGAVLLVLVVQPQLYPWSTGDFGQTGGALGFKRAWLDREFFLARAVAYAAVWSLFARGIRRRAGGNPKVAGWFLAVFALTFSLATFDWIMSLEPGWYSTIFATYHFAGLFLAALAAVVLLVLWAEASGPLRSIVHDSHLHDLGKLLFAFSTFWAYVWFSQFMLVWYANVPEETVYFVARTHGSWYAVFVLNVILNWTIPFAVLIRRDAKRNRRVLAIVSILVLLGRWTDLYLMLLPPVLGDTPRFGVWEGGMLAGGVGTTGLMLTHAARLDHES